MSSRMRHRHVWPECLVIAVLVLSAMITSCTFRESPSEEVAQEERREPALLDAVYRGDVDAVTRLLGEGQDVNQRLTTDWRSEDGTLLASCGITALHLAGTLEMVELLLTHHADPNARDCGGQTVLLDKIRWEEPVVIVALLQAGADPNLANEVPTEASGSCGGAEALPEQVQKFKTGQRPLHLADTAEKAALLLDHGAALEAVTGMGLTALHYMAMMELTDVVQFLLFRGANVHARTKEGLTPLHFAAQDGARLTGDGRNLHRIEVMTLLLKAGADPKARDAEGKTPADWAKSTGYSEGYEFLTVKARKQ